MAAAARTSPRKMAPGCVGRHFLLIATMLISVLQIYVDRVAILETKCHSTVARPERAPRTLAVTFQLMEIEPWHIIPRRAWLL